MAARELDLARFEVDAGDGDSGKGRGENAERRPGGAADLEHALAIPIVEPERNQGVAPVLRLPDETFLLRRRIAGVAATSATGWLTGEPSQTRRQMYRRTSGPRSRARGGTSGRAAPMSRE